MPFLSIFRKDKSPLPPSPTTSRKSSSFSRAQSRPSLTSTRAASPPPQLADISPQSELSYVLPELDECAEVPTTKRRGVLQRRRESGPPRLSHERPLSDIKPTERPFSALDGFMTHTDKSRDPNIRNSGDSDDDPLVPPPPRASVFAGFSYDDRPKSQSLPDHTRPGPVHSSSDPMPKPSKGLFSWRSKSKEPPAPDESFSLKSFRHVGPPSSPINDEGNSFGSTAASATTTPPTSTPSSIPPTSTSTPRPIPGRSTPTARERVSSVGSEGMMPAGLFRQAARRSSTNLVEDTIEPKPRIRDNDRRGPPTRAWDDGQSSGSERRPRTNSAVGRSSSAIPYVGRKSMALDDDDSSPEPASPFAGRLSESPFGSRNDFSHIPRGEYSQYGSRSDGGIRIARPRPSSPAKLQTTRPGPTPAARQPSSPPAPSIISNSSILSSSPPQLSLGFAPQKRSDSPTKPRHSAPAPRPTRSPIRTTIPTKTNDGPSIKPLRPGSPAKSHGRQKSTDTLGRGHARQQSTDTLGRHGRQQSTDTLGRGHGRQQSTDTLGRGHARNQSGDMLNRSTDNLGHARNQSGDTLGHARNQSGDTLRNGHRRQPSGDITPEVTSHIRRPSAFEVVSRPKSPAPSMALGSSSRAGSVADLTASRSGSVGSGSSRPKTPIDSPMERAKSPVPTAASRAKSPAPTLGSRAKSPGPAIGRPTITTAVNQRPGPTPASSNQRVPVGQRTKSGTYVPPPRQSSLAPGLVDSDSDESPEEESSDEFGAEKERVDGADSFGARVAPGAPGVGAMRGKAGFAGKVEPAKPGQGEPPKPEEQGLSRERTITQRDRAPPRIGVSLFDKPVPEVSAEPPKTFGRTRASHSTSAISAAATARNSAAMAEANRALGVRGPGHVRAPAEGSGHLRTATEGSIHVRAPAETDTDEDEEDEKSDSDESDDNAPLASLAPARRPGSAASTNTTNTTAMTRTAVVKPSPNVTSRPPVSRGIRQPLIDMAGPAPARPARRVPGVGVTRNSSLRGSRSVEDLARMSTGTSVPRPGPRPSVPTPSRPGPRPSDVARPGPRPSDVNRPGPRPSDVRPGPRPSVPGRPGPRPFANSPPSSTGDSSSGKAPLTPRDGSEAGAVRGSDEARRKERRRSEAKASVDLANVINGPGPVDDDDEEDHSPHHSQVGHGMMGGGMGMGWNQSGFLAQGGFGFPASQSMPFLHPQLTGPATAMGFMPPPPPPGASEAYMAAHHQAMMIAKQTYLSAVAQQAMAAATEQWERSSNVGGGSVYGGSQMGGMSMPMMGMYANSAYAASSYEPSVMGGWGSGSVYGGSVYGGGARSEYGGPKPTHGRTRSRTQTSPSDAPLPPQNRNAVPPSTWTTRRTKGI